MVSMGERVADQENFAYEHWDDILDICKKYDVLGTRCCVSCHLGPIPCPEKP